MNGSRRFYPTCFRCGVSACWKPPKITISSQHGGVNDALFCCSQHPLPLRPVCQGLFDSLGRIRSASPVVAEATPGGELLDTSGDAIINGGSEHSGDFIGRFVHRGRRDPSADQVSVLPAALARALASSAAASLLSHPDVTECLVAERGGDGEGGGDAGIAAESNCDEYARLVAEAYLHFPPRSQEQPPSSSSSCLSSPPPLVQVQTDERLRFLRSLTELIEGAAEEIVCEMSMSGYSYSDAVRRMTNGLWNARCELTSVADAADGDGHERFR